jgi:hypothetical protein
MEIVNLRTVQAGSHGMQQRRITSCVGRVEAPLCCGAKDKEVVLRVTQLFIQQLPNVFAGGAGLQVIVGLLDIVINTSYADRCVY